MILAEGWTISSWAAVMLAVVATLGYLVGRRKTDTTSTSRNNTRHEILRALAVAQELETIAYRLRKSMANHVPAIVRFNNQLHRWEHSNELSWHELCEKADDLLKPALRLSTEISHAYADLLQQMTQLSAFAELRTDPLTGVANRRAFDDALSQMLIKHENDELPLSIAMLDLDNFKSINDEQGHLTGDRVLQDLTQLLKALLREGDVLARYGGEEFVILMPHTPLRSACSLAHRARARIEEKLPTTISIGVGATMPTESATSLVSRADAALYAAKREGRNCVCQHEGANGKIVTLRNDPTAEPSKSDAKTPAAITFDLPVADAPAVHV